MGEQEKNELVTTVSDAERYTSNDVHQFCHKRYSLSHVMMDDIYKRTTALIKQDPNHPYLEAAQLIHVFHEQALVDDFIRFCETNRLRRKRIKTERPSTPYHPAPQARTSPIKVESAFDIVLRIIKELEYGGSRPGLETRLSPKESAVVLKRLNQSRETYKVYYQTLRPITVREILQAIEQAHQRAFEGL